MTDTLPRQTIILINGLKNEGYAKPKKTVKSIESMETKVESALTEGTEYFVSELQKSDSLQDLKKNWNKVKEKDRLTSSITKIAEDEFYDMMPNLIQQYIRADKPQF